MQIEDGQGTGRLVGVSNDNMMRVTAIMATREHHANHSHGNAYQVYFAVTPDAPADCLFYLKNNSIMDITIEGVTWQVGSAEQAVYKIGETGTAVLANGAVVTPGNLNSGSGNVADCTCWAGAADEGVDITGLSGGATVEHLWLTSATSSYFNLEQDIIITPQTVFSIYCVTGSVAIRGTVVFNFHDK